MRVRTLPLVIALLFLAAACGQKSGVAGSTAETAGSLAGGVDGATGGAGTDGGAAIGGDGGTGGGAAGGGGGGAAAGGGGGGGVTGGTSSTGSTAASGPADRTGITKTSIKIGIHAPISGAAAVSTFEQGVGVYSDWAGQIKGLGNRRIEVVYRDDHFDPATARTVCKEMVEKEKVFLLIGGAGVDQIKSCAEYAAQAGIPYFSPGVTEGPFRGLQNYFALSETYTQQNVQLAQLIKNQVKKKKIGMVLTDSPLLKETEDSFKAEAQKSGLQVVYTGKLAKDAGKNQTDTQVSNLKSKGAEVVYALISPTVFGYLVASAKQQSYRPTFTGPGLSAGVNLVATAVCPPPPFPDVRYMSPMVQTDVIDQYDKDYNPAYREKNGSEGDDIGILLWGIEKTMRLMMESAGADISRQSLIKSVTSGKPFASNVYAPVSYGGVPHFGAKAVTLLTLDCQNLRYKTTKAFGSQF
ncbi:MAG TPA: ABC transporter substrate-binding protein [Actinomycetota bacterium]|jgi:ABC-type branched-subunit amino acid transport system substrate-binding protein|nr:ABC transporter substrate-binding protein [Actinomycetota bacterium]